MPVYLAYLRTKARQKSKEHPSRTLVREIPFFSLARNHKLHIQAKELAKVMLSAERGRVRSQAARRNRRGTSDFLLFSRPSWAEDANPRIPMTFRGTRWRQAGKRVKESTVERRENGGRQAAKKTPREGEGAHYVSVISRIQRVFSICSKAPLVRTASCRSAVWAR